MAAVLTHCADGSQFISRKRSLFKSTSLTTSLLQRDRGGYFFFVVVGFCFFPSEGNRALTAQCIKMHRRGSSFDIINCGRDDLCGD